VALTFTGTAFRGSATKVTRAGSRTDHIHSFTFRQGETFPLCVNHGAREVGRVTLHTIIDATGPVLRATGVIFDEPTSARVRSGELLGLSVGVAKKPGTVQTVDATTRVLDAVRPSEVSLCASPASADAWIETVAGRPAGHSQVRMADDRERERVAREKSGALLGKMLDAVHAEHVAMRARGYRWNS
jgi:hypothetical protein